MKQNRVHQDSANQRLFDEESYSQQERDSLEQEINQIYSSGKELLSNERTVTVKPIQRKNNRQQSQVPLIKDQNKTIDQDDEDDDETKIAVNFDQFESTKDKKKEERKKNGKKTEENEIGKKFKKGLKQKFALDKKQTQHTINPDEKDIAENDHFEEDGDDIMAKPRPALNLDQIDSTLLPQQQEQQQQDLGNKKNDQIVENINNKWWIMEVGEKKEEQVGSLEEILNNNDNEVFPMSLSYTNSQIFKMRLFRFIVLFVCLFQFVPYDFYISAHRRISYFGTDTYEDIIKFSDITDKFSFSLQNCQIFFKDLSSTDEKMKLQYGFDFGTSFQLNNSYLGISADPSQTCIVNIFLPSNVPLPLLQFNITGNQQNILLNDDFLGGKSLNFNNGLILKGETAFITLRNHQISQLNISFTFSICKLYNIQAIKKYVNVWTGLYSEQLPSSFAINQVSVNQSSSQICLYGPQVIDGAGSNCPLILSNVTTGSSQCLYNAFICQESAANCSTAKPDSYSSIVLRDGPIQIKINDESKSKKNTAKYLPKNSISFNKISNIFLNQSRLNYELDEQNGRLSVLSTIGIEYQRNWVYTNSKVYLEAQFWPLIWGSGTLLTPSMDYNKLIIIDIECPARTQFDNIDINVNDYYSSYYPQTSYSSVALIKGFSKFYKVSQNLLGEIQYNQITIDSNPTIIGAFTVASVISLIGSALLANFVFLVYKVLFKKYQDFINSQKSFAVTKKQAALSESKGLAVEESVKFEFQSKQNVLETRGIFSSSFDFMDRTKGKRNFTYKFSIFQIPTLYIDYMLRKQSDSLKEFLLQIYESKQQFSNVKVKLQDRQLLSILLDDFQKLYSDFCQKYGYIEQNVERDGQETLKRFQLTLENQQGQEQSAYANIRFKTNKERGNKQPTQQNLSIIQQFLNEECVYTQFETDFILFDDMKKAYRNFCSLQGKSESEQEQVIGSEELRVFGAIVKQVPPPMRIFGIKFDKFSDPKRIPLIRRPTNYKPSYISTLLKQDGFLTNAAFTIVHVIIILSIPLLTPVITYEALKDMTKLQEDVYEKPLALTDFYNTNRLDPWWDNIPHIDIFLYIHIYVVIFFILSLVELISYYITGFQNNGRFPVQYSIQKRILTKLFYIFIGIFMILYFAYFWFILVWAVLAAVLNPNKFLPYAAAAMTLFTTIAVKIVYYKTRHQNMIKNLDRIVSEKLNLVVEQSVAKLKKMTKEKLDKVALPIANDSFHRELNSHFEQFFDSSSRGIIDGLKDGNLTNVINLSKLASSALGGLQSTIIEFTIGIITKNKSQINEGLRKLTQELNVEFEFIETIAELVQNDYNPELSGQDELLGQVEIQIKKLFRKLSPNINAELFGELIKIVIQGDAFPLRKHLNELDSDQEMYAELYKMLIYCQQDNRGKVKDQLIAFLESAIDLKKDTLKELILRYQNYSKLSKEERKMPSADPLKPEELQELQEMIDNKNILKSFKTLQKLGDGNLNMLMNELNMLKREENKTSKLIRFKDNFPLLFMSAYSRRSSTLTTQVINQSFKEILFLKEMMEDENLKEIVKKDYMTHKHMQTITEKFFLALYILIKGETMDMKRISNQVQKKDPNFDQDLFTLIHLCATNSPQSFQAIVYRLDCASDMDLLMELYQIVNQSDVTPFEICKKIGFNMGKAKLFTAIVVLLYRLMKYELTYKKRRQDYIKDPTKKLQAQHKAEFRLIRSKISDSFQALYSKLEINVSAYPGYQDFIQKPIEKDPKDVSNGSRAGSRQGSRQGSRLGSRGNQGSEIDDNASNKESENDEKNQNNDLDQADNDNDQQDDEDPDAKKDREQIQKIKYLVKNLFTNFSKDDDFIEKTNKIKELWKLIAKERKIVKCFKTEEMFMVARCYAVMMVRNDQLLSQNDKDYTKCVRFLSEFFDIEYEKVDFMIDIISGHPLDVFKANPKNPTYNLQSVENDDDDDSYDNFKFNARFDNQRMALLSNMFLVDRKTLTYACALWYHYYRFFRQGIGRIPLFMKVFDLSTDFIDILQMIRLNSSENHANFDQAFLIKKMVQYLQHGINSTLKKLGQGVLYQTKIYQNNEDRKKLISDQFFVEEMDQLNEEQEKNKEYIAQIENIPSIPFDIAQNLLTIMDKFIKIKQCDKEVYIQLLKLEPGENFIRLFISILKGVQIDTSAHSVLYLLSFLSKQIPMFKKGMINWKEKKQRISKTDQHLFISFGLLINAFQFKNICRSKEFDKIQIAKILHKYVKLVNQAYNLKKGDKMQYIDEENYRILLQTLFQSNFFLSISHKILKIVVGREANERLCNSIMGLLLGSAINDRSLIRFSVLNMLDRHQLNLQMLEGLGAALVNDIRADSQIKYFCKNLDLDGQYLINLIDFVEKKPNNLPQILFDLLSNITPDQINICASLIHVMKGDIAMVKAIAQRLSIDPKQIIPVFAAATGNLSILAEFYGDLAIKMELNSQNTVKVISELAYCRTGSLYQLAQKSSKRFTIIDPELVESIFRVTYYGKQMYDRTIENFEQVTNIENSLSVLARKITKVFGLSSDIGSEINKFTTIMIKSCWNDPVALLQLRKKLEKIKRPDSIWKQNDDEYLKTGVLSQLPDSVIYKFLKRKLRQLADETWNMIATISNKQKVLIKLLKRDIIPYIYKIGEKERMDEEFISKATDSLIKYYKKAKSPEDDYILQKITEKYEQIDPDICFQKQVAYKAGCSFGIGLYKKFQQPFFHCIDCNSNPKMTDETLIFCLSCAIFCHAGHKVYPGNYGKESKIICDCGQGKFHKCDIDENPNNEIIKWRKQFYKDNQNIKNENEELNSSCSMLNPMFEKAQNEAIKEIYKTKENLLTIVNKDRKEDIYVNETEDNYQVGDFLVDLYSAFDLPKFFDGENKKTRNDLAKYLGSYPDTDDKIEYLIDIQTSMCYSLAENIIIMGFGFPSQSFLTLLSVKKSYNISDFQNQMIYPTKAANIVSRSLSSYQTISCFVGIAQQDFYKIQKFGETISEALGEVSSKEQSACDKICNVLRLSKGASLPSFDSQVEPGKIVQKNHYYLLFKRLFDSKGYKIMVIHKLLQCSQKELISILGLDGKAQTNSDLKNISEWVENELFENILQLDEKSKLHCKHVIGLFCSHRDSFDFISKEKGIPSHKAQMYKALLNSDLKELMPLFDNLKMMIPLKFNAFMLNVWKGDTLAVISFIVEFLKVNGEMFGSWKKFKDPKIDDDDTKQKYRYLQHLYALMSGDVQETEKSFKYIIKRMIREDLNVDDKDYDEEKVKHEDKLAYAMMSASAVFYSSVIDVPKIAITIEKDSVQNDQNNNNNNNNNQIEDQKTGGPEPVITLTDKQLIKSLINIVNKTWQNKDIENVIQALGKSDQIPKESPYFSYIRNLLQATEGDLINFGKICDELLSGSVTHFKSLLTSLIAGSTKFDQAEEDYEDQQQKLDAGTLIKQGNTQIAKYRDFNKEEKLLTDPKYQKNLLIQEMYIIYEKIIKFDFSEKQNDNQKVSNLINWSFTKQIPYFLLMVMSEDKNFIDKLFDPSKIFHNNLITDDEKKKITGERVDKKSPQYAQFDCQKFLSSLFDFLDPFTTSNNIKNVLKQVLGKKQIDVTISYIKKHKNLDGIGNLGLEENIIDERSMKVYNNLSKELSLKNLQGKDQEFFQQVDIFALAKLLSNCYQMDSSSIKNLYLVFKDLFKNDVILQNLFTLVFKLFNKDKTNIFDNLPSVVAVLVERSKQNNNNNNNNNNPQNKDNKIVLDKNDELMILMISRWMHAIIIMLDKENKFDVERDGIKQVFFNALSATETYYLNGNNLLVGQDNILSKHQDLNFLADILVGVMAVCKQDFPNIKPLALKIGGFPNVQVLSSFFYIIRKNKDVLGFDTKSLIQASQATNQLGMIDGDDDQDFSMGMNPRQIFNYFSKKNFGSIGVEEFQELVKYMGINLSYTKMLQIYSKVDVDKSGDLEFTEFLRGLAELKTLVIYESIERIGLSVNDLVISFLISMVILIMTFVFIFVSIQAFSTTTTFSSVTNSMLPIIAGGAVNKSGSGDGDADDKDVQDVVDENLS